MPIKPENRKRYPANWKEIRAGILKRADDRCEFCGVKNHSMVERPGKATRTRIVLTVAHLDHQPENNDPENLRALCQKCHLRYDHDHHQRNARETRRQKVEAIQPSLKLEASR